MVGQDHAVELLLIAAIARGHALIEGPPGSAKTLIGRAMAHVLGAHFKRVQFTPDTSPEELTGHYEKRFGEIVFDQGAVFTNVLLADEINRTPPRTQAALLEAMQEGSVTVDGNTHRLPDPFLVIATQNPYEHEGIFPLPESQLDRFLFKIDVDYCGEEHERQMLRLAHTGITPDTLAEIRPLLGIVGLDRARTELDATQVPDETIEAIVSLVRATRRDGRRHPRRQLAGGVPPARREQGSRPPRRALVGDDGRRTCDRAVRPAAPPDLRGHHARRGAATGARPHRLVRC